MHTQSIDVASQDFATWSAEFFDQVEVDESISEDDKAVFDKDTAKLIACMFLVSIMTSMKSSMTQSDADIINRMCSADYNLDFYNMAAKDICGPRGSFIAGFEDMVSNAASTEGAWALRTGRKLLSEPTITTLLFQMGGTLLDCCDGNRDKGVIEFERMMKLARTWAKERHDDLLDQIDE